MGKKGTGTTKNAVILAAGIGKRLHPITLTIPKCLVDINGTSILERMLINLSEAGVTDVTIVVGYLRSQIKEKFGESYNRMSIRYITNTSYETTNSMYSLLLGLVDICEDTWVIEGDIVFDKSILKLPVHNDISWFTDFSTIDIDGAYIETDPEGYVTRLNIIRDLDLIKGNMSKSVGILHIPKKDIGQVISWLCTGASEGKTNSYYDLILAEHLDQRRIKIVDVVPARWCEVDTLQDLEVAREMFR